MTKVFIPTLSIKVSIILYKKLINKFMYFDTSYCWHKNSIDLILNRHYQYYLIHTYIFIINYYYLRQNFIKITWFV